MKNKEYEKLNKVIQKYLNRLMVGALDIVENEYNKDDRFTFVRSKILSLGNDQKRDKEVLLKNYIIKEEFKLLMEFKKELENNKGKE